MAPHPSIRPDAERRDAKAGPRAAALARRGALAPSARQAASAAIARGVLALPELAAPDCVGAYWPIRGEVDTRALLGDLAARGREVALPRVEGASLSFRRWRPGDPLVRGALGAPEPGPGAPECRPRALLVPLAAFDRRGHRLGYGGGYFDRAAAALARRGPLLMIGLAFALQEIPRVPDEPHDHRLDAVVTEAGVVRPPASPEGP